MPDSGHQRTTRAGRHAHAEPAAWPDAGPSVAYPIPVVRERQLLADNGASTPLWHLHYRRRRRVSGSEALVRLLQEELACEQPDSQQRRAENQPNPWAVRVLARKHRTLGV